MPCNGAITQQRQEWQKAQQEKGCFATRNSPTEQHTAEPSSGTRMRRPVTPRREAEPLGAPVDDAAFDVIAVVGAGVVDVVAVLVAVALGLADADAVVLVLADGLASRTPAVDGSVCGRGEEKGEEGLRDLHGGLLLAAIDYVVRYSLSKLAIGPGLVPGKSVGQLDSLWPCILATFEIRRVHPVRRIVNHTETLYKLISKAAPGGMFCCVDWYEKMVRFQA